MDYQAILDTIHRDIQPYLGQGRVADYIPELAGASATDFGMAIVTLGGDVYTVGKADVPFSIQSVSKLFACTLAFQL